MTRIFVDADACPVKDEIYRVAARYELRVVLVANRWMRTPPDPSIELVEVGSLFDDADDWIAENVGERDIVVTSDIPLAGRCLAKGARVVDPRGRCLTEDDIGSALAMRELFSHLRDLGELTSSGPKPFGPRDRSAFLQVLDELINAIRRGR
ncbi:MAG: YaiI/YqxD family protein [Planctomycetota bacterium]